MGEEKNRATLVRAIAQLRTYTPGAGAWARIEARLANPGEVDVAELKLAVQRLPGYAPPPAVWNEINRTLDDDRAARRVVLTRRRWAMRIAAGLAILLTAGWWLLRESPPKVSIAYRQETVMQFNIVPDWDTEADAFQHLEGQLAAVNDPQLNNLRLEMEELTSAKEEVEAMLNNYGQDPQLIRQLSEIERERSELYRQIIELI